MTDNIDYNKFCYYDDGLLYNNITNEIYGTLDPDGYIRLRLGGKKLRAHRVIWEMLKGEIPEGYVIDHKDGNRANNRIENLRLATNIQNSANTKGFGTYPKGVKSHRNKFQARIRYMGKYIHIGTFSTVEEAAEAYKLKAIEIHGEFAKQ